MLHRLQHQNWYFILYFNQKTIFYHDTHIKILNQKARLDRNLTFFFSLFFWGKITVQIDLYKMFWLVSWENPANFDRWTTFVGPVVPEICLHLLLCLFGHLSIGKPDLFFTCPTQILPVPDSGTVYNFHHWSKLFFYGFQSSKRAKNPLFCIENVCFFQWKNKKKTQIRGTILNTCCLIAYHNTLSCIHCTWRGLDMEWLELVCHTQNEPYRGDRPSGAQSQHVSLWNADGNYL